MAKKIELVLLAAALACAAVAAAPKFEKVPSAAMKALQGVRGKLVSSGLVFANGHYLKPPYRVARLGTAIFINDEQVSNQIVPWKAFLATQSAAASAAPAPAAAQPKKAADDLFDEEPVVDKAAEARKAAAKQEEQAVSFTPNAQSKKLMKRINDNRSLIDRTLRGNNIIFFGSRYGRVKVDPQLAIKLLNVLPEAMAEANDGAALSAMMRAKGFPFMSKELCEDLIANRKDYLLLVERREKLRAESELQNVIQGSSK